MKYEYYANETNYVNTDIRKKVENMYHQRIIIIKILITIPFLIR